MVSRVASCSFSRGLALTLVSYILEQQLLKKCLSGKERLKKYRKATEGDKPRISKKKKENKILKEKVVLLLKIKAIRP